MMGEMPFTKIKLYPLYLILITIPFAHSTQSFEQGTQPANSFTALVHNEKKSSIAFPMKGVTEESSNVPIRMCRNSERGELASLISIYLDPPCEDLAGGFCGLRRNQNYSFFAKFRPSASVQKLSVRVTTTNEHYGFETMLWPEFSVCSRFNITCPQNSNNLVEAFLDSDVPGVPPTRALVRVRLLGMNEDFVKRVYICREFNVQLF